MYNVVSGGIDAALAVATYVVPVAIVWAIVARIRRTRRERKEAQ